MLIRVFHERLFFIGVVQAKLPVWTPDWTSPSSPEEVSLDQAWEYLWRIQRRVARTIIFNHVCWMNKESQTFSTVISSPWNKSNLKTYFWLLTNDTGEIWSCLYWNIFFLTVKNHENVTKSFKTFLRILTSPKNSCCHLPTSF